LSGPLNRDLLNSGCEHRPANNFIAGRNINWLLNNAENNVFLNARNIAATLVEGRKINAKK
jgi:hypothetical protein